MLMAEVVRERRIHIGLQMDTDDVAITGSTWLCCTSAQCNYPVHKQELTVGVGTMLRHCDILQGVRFTWVTDHKSLNYILWIRKAYLAIKPVG